MSYWALESAIVFDEDPRTMCGSAMFSVVLRCSVAVSLRPTPGGGRGAHGACMVLGQWARYIRARTALAMARPIHFSVTRPPSRRFDNRHDANDRDIGATVPTAFPGQCKPGRCGQTMDGRADSWEPDAGCLSPFR